jgi:hypothetical protein
MGLDFEDRQAAKRWYASSESKRHGQNGFVSPLGHPKRFNGPIVGLHRNEK